MPYYSTDAYFGHNWQHRPYEDVPLPLAIELAEIVTDACQWFHDPKHIFLGDPSAPDLPDAAVDEVCAALQHQLDKEGRSRTRGTVCSRHGLPHTHWYQLADLPMPRKRALAERIWALKQREEITVRMWKDPLQGVPTYADLAREPAAEVSYAANSFENVYGWDYA